MWRAWSQRRLRAETVDRLVAVVLLAWALFDVPWWWRPPGHGGSALVILGVIALAAAQSVPFLRRRQQPAAVLALTGAALAVKYAAGLNIWSAGAAVLAAAYGLGAYGSRARLARELHDVVAHELSAIAVQAGAARLAAAGEPQAAVAAIAAIERQARDGLTELNQLVRELRPAGDTGPDTSPQPRLGDIPGLIKRAAEAGMRAELRVDGEPRPLPPAVELAGYRVVQESLTNAIRYAAGAGATVRLAYRDDGIMVEVTDDGPGAAAAAVAIRGGGTGLAGLRERARLLGGQLEAGSAAERGFAVRAFLPGPP